MKSKLRQLVLLLMAQVLCMYITTYAQNTQVISEHMLSVAEKLNSFGIIQMPENKAELNRNVTRGEMVEILAAYLEVKDDVYNTSETSFIDISIQDENVGLYNMLYDFGYINGDTSGRFNPDRNMTCNEAVKFTVTAMGYGFIAEKSGGYPDGYMNVAVKNGLLKGVSVSGDGYITMKDLCCMLEASLDAPSLDDVYLKGDGTVEIKLNTEASVLEKIHGISKIRGIVTGNENTRLDSPESYNIGRYDIEIDNVLYRSGDKEYADYLGFKVDAYVRENNDGENEAVYISKVQSTSVVRVDAEDLVKEKCTDSKIVYEENDKQRDLTLEKEKLSVILNGKRYSGGSNTAALLPEEGYIECIDNSGDNKADVLIIYECRNFAVGAVDVLTGKLTEKYTGEIIIADSREDEVRVYDKDKNPIAFSEIKAGDVLTVFESADLGGYRLISLYKCSEAVTLTVSAIEDGEEYFIGDKSYKLASNIEEHIKNKIMRTPDVGEDITFVADINGKIADFTVCGVSQMLYGVVAARSDRYKLKDGFQVKIFNQSGEWILAKVSDQVKIDGNKYSPNTSNGLAACINLIPVGEVVRYRMTDGLISHIDTIISGKEKYTDDKDKNESTEGETPDEGNKDDKDKKEDKPDEGTLRLIASGTQFVSRGGMCWKYGSNGIDSEAFEETFVLTENTVVFRIPDKDNLSDETLYSVSNQIGGNYFSDWTPHGDGSVRIKDGYCAYNTKSEDIEVAACVLLKGCEETGTGINYYERFYVITDIRTAINENGEKVPMLYYSQGSGERSNPVAEKVFFSFGNSVWSAQRESDFYAEKLRKGDIIQVGFNENEINFINVVYRIDQTAQNKAWAAYPMHIAGFDLDKGIICARVKSVNNKAGVLQYYIEDGSSEAKNYIISVPSYIPVIIYREEENAVETGSLASITQEDLVIIKCSYGTNADQVIVMR